MFSIQDIIEFAKVASVRRELEVPVDYWYTHMPCLEKVLRNMKRTTFEHEFAEETLNYMLACAYHYVKHGKLFSLKDAQDNRLRCPPGRLDMSVGKNYCGSTQ